MKIRIITPDSMDGSVGVEQMEVLTGMANLRNDETYENAAISFADGTGSSDDEFYNARGSWRKERERRRRLREKNRDRKLAMREKRTSSRASSRTSRAKSKVAQATSQSDIAKALAMADPMQMIPPSPEPAKTGMSTGVKVAIGIGVVAALAITAAIVIKQMKAAKK